MDYMSRIENGNIAVAYTVWSRKRGAGREIINKLAEWAKKHHCERLVTLSPLTPMATHFHITNGAKQIKVSEETQNFEYKLYEKNKTK
jgi:GNAT superfamily N-acetyltransferase